MSRTLADMTPEERQQMIGQWCDHDDMGRIKTSIITRISHARGEKNYLETRAILYWPEQGHWSVRGEELHTVTPRLDLPRAWAPDGTPPKGEWAEGHMWWGEDTDTMEPVDLVGAECLATGHIQGFGEWPDGVTPGEDVPVRRYITDWEEA